MNFSNAGNRAIPSAERVAGVLAVVVCVYALLFSWWSWREEKFSQIDRLATITELGSRSVETYFTQLDLALRSLSDDLTATGDPIDLDRAFGFLKRFLDLHSDLVNVTLIRPDGQILLTAKTPPGAAQPSLAAERSFLQYRDEPQRDGANVGRPMVGVVSHVPTVPLRYAIKDREDRPLYILSANLSAGLLESFWKEAPITQKAALGLIRDDGFLVCRYPVPGRLSQEDIYGKPRTGALIKHLQQSGFPTSGYVEGPSSLDGPDFLTAYRRLSRFPITLFVAMPLSEIRAAWWEKVLTPYLLTALLLVGGVAVHRFALRRQRAWERERDAAHDALRASEERLQRVLEGANDGFWDWSVATGEVLFSRRWAEILGYSPEDIAPHVRSWEKLVHPDDWPRCQSALQSHFAGETARYQTEHRLRAKDGEWRWVLDRGKVTARDPDGRPLRMAGTHTDITDRRRMQAALQASETLLRTIYDLLPVGISITDRSGHLVDCNRASETLLGLSRDEQLRRDYPGGEWAIVRPDGTPMPSDEYASVRAMREQRTVRDVEMGIVRPEGITWISVSATPSTHPDYGAVIAYVDITERKRAAAALRESNEILSLFMKHSPIFAYIKAVTPTESRVLKASENFRDLIGIPGSELAGKTMEDLFPAEFAAKMTADDWAVVSSGKTLELDEDLNGRRYTTLKFPIFLSGRNLLAGYSIDITDRERMQEALREQATHDPLTGLLNRRSLDEMLPRELHRHQRSREPLAVAMLDLDHFKRFNDAHGHGAGDAVLRAMGELLRKSLRASDLACRYGGEELTVVLPGSTLNDARIRLDELRRAVGQLRLLYRDGELPALTVSIGIAAAEPEETDATALLGRADAALYQAKEQGRNKVVTFEAGLPPASP